MSSQQPVLIHIIFHPESGSAREMARHIHQEFNANPLVPGLRLPTTFCGYSPEGRPLPVRWGQARRDFVVVLADDKMNLDEAWCSFVAETWEKCQNDSARCVPIQLTPAAWPLDPRLEGVSFARAFQEFANESERGALVVRRLVVELCRFLANLEAVADSECKVPVYLFLSHTKLDYNREPHVTKQFIDALKADQPVEAWVDSGDISIGSEFAKTIDSGVARTSVLAILTDSYATREWCREEILLAKEKQRPVVIVDALSGYEVRSFPYLGNVPRIRWDGDPQKGIDLLLKETLRHLHTMAVLQRVSEPSDVVFSRSPELATLVGLDSGTTVLYPDPPLGVGESRRLSRAGVPFFTPLGRVASDPSLKGRKVALSMSESTDIAQYGMDALHLEDCMLDISRYMLIKGATLAYGGHLGTEGYTQKLFELVRTHNSLADTKSCERIVNFLGWPLPRLSDRQKSDLKSVAIIQELPRPADVAETLNPDFVSTPVFFPAEKSARHRFAWARGMTEMREYQADRIRSGVAARIVIGGTFGPTEKVGQDGSRTAKWYAGRIPGVLEEVVLSLQAGQPVFLIGAFGGAAKLIIDLIHGVDRPEATWEYQKRAPFADEMRKMYEERGLSWMDYPEITALLREKAPAFVNPGLSLDEKEELFETVDPSRMVQLILQGLSGK